MRLIASRTDRRSTHATSDERLSRTPNSSGNHRSIFGSRSIGLASRLRSLAPHIRHLAQDAFPTSLAVSKDISRLYAPLHILMLYGGKVSARGGCPSGRRVGLVALLGRRALSSCRLFTLRDWPDDSPSTLIPPYNKPDGANRSPGSLESWL